MKKIWIPLVIFLVIIIVMLIGMYNTFVTKDQAVNKAWAQVENVMQRRADLINNLVETVKGYASHERGTFIEVAKARAQIQSAKTVGEMIDADNQLTSALSKLMLVVERYPELKANQNFLALQDELAGTENRISVERKRYIEAVNDYNSYAKKFFRRQMAGLFGFPAEREYFKAVEGAKTPPKVDFSQ